MCGIVESMRDSSFHEKEGQGRRNSSSEPKVDVEQTSDLHDCVVEIVRALARAAARRDHREAREAELKIATKAARR